MADRKIFVINMDKSADRLAFVKGQLDGLSIGFERIAGVDAASLSEADIAKVYSPEINRKCYVRPLHRGQIACYLAHMKAWRAIVEQNLDYAVILEDDVYIYDAFVGALSALESSYPNWDFVRLEENSKPKKIFSERKITPSASLAVYINTPGGATSYALTAAAAKKMLASLIPFGMPVDIQQQYLYRLGIKVECLRPPSTYNGEVGLESELRAVAGERTPRHYPLCRQVLSVKFYAAAAARLISEFGFAKFALNLGKMCFRKPSA